MAAVYEERPRPRRRRGRGLLITLLVLLLILAAAVVFGDRFARGFAERTISDKVAEQVANQKATSDKPDVTIEGFPFVTQVAAGHYDAIHIQLPNFSGPAGDGRTISTNLLDIRATDVRAPLSTIRSGSGDIVAGAVGGTGLIDYQQLAKLVGQEGVQLTARDGKLVGTAPVQALGQTFKVSATADLTVAKGVVQVRFSDLQAEGLPNVALIKGLLDAYAQKLAFDIKVPPLPLKLVVQKVTVLPKGLQFTAGARNVKLNSSGL